MAAMVECAIVLAIKRLRDKQFCCQQQEVRNCNQILIISKGNRNHKPNGNDNFLGGEEGLVSSPIFDEDFDHFVHEDSDEAFEEHDIAMHFM